MNEEDQQFLMSVLGGYFSKQVNPPSVDITDEVQSALSDAAERSRFRRLFQQLVNDPQPNASDVVELYLVEAARDEQKAQARLGEVWEKCFGAAGILTDEAMAKAGFA
jgi:hypothetical protein